MKTGGSLRLWAAIFFGTSDDGMVEVGLGTIGPKDITFLTGGVFRGSLRIGRDHAL